MNNALSIEHMNFSQGKGGTNLFSYHSVMQIQPPSHIMYYNEERTVTNDELKRNAL